MVTPATGRSVQRSFRLSAATAAALDAAAEGTDESRNSLVERYLREALRRDRHPLVTFRATSASGRVACLLGTRLDVHRLVSTFTANDRDVARTAEYFGVDESWVRAGIEYYVEYSDEIDSHLMQDEAFAARERDLWERTQALIA